MGTTFRARTALLMAVAGIAAVAPSAHAGSYTVHSCRSPQGAPAAIGDGSYGWQGSIGGAFASAANQCEASGYFGGRLTGTTPHGNFARYRFVAPPNTAITAYQLHWSGFAGGSIDSTSWVGDVYAIRSDQADPNYVARRYGGGGFGDGSSPFSDANRLEQTGLDVTNLTLVAACSPGNGPGTASCPTPAPGGETSAFRVYRSRFTLRDSSAPTVGNVSGDALSDETLSGNETVTLNALDTGAGIYRLIVEMDGQDAYSRVIEPDGGRCADADPSNQDAYEFVRPQPCPLSSSGDVVIDTNGLPEGAHTFRLKVEDAAGNRTTVYGPATKTVDNVPPPQPTGAPSTAGSGSVGQTLVADNGQWNGEGVTFSYQWQRCQLDGSNCVDIPGATGKTYTLTDADAGHAVRVLVTAKNSEGSTTAASQPKQVGGGSNTTPSTASGGAAGVRGTSGALAGTANGGGASALARVIAAFNGQRVIRTRYGKRVLLSGRVLNEHGQPVTSAVVDVLERARGRNEIRVIGTVTTASDGSFSYLLPVGASRLVRFAYRFRAGDAEFAHVSDVEVVVKAAVSLTATKRVRGKQTLRFRGRVPGARRGTSVLLQAKVGRRWQIFERARVGSGGRFKASYVFRRTRVRTTFAFRVVYAGKDGSNLDPARSRVVKVRYTP